MFSETERTSLYPWECKSDNFTVIVVTLCLDVKTRHYNIIIMAIQKLNTWPDWHSLDKNNWKDPHLSILLLGISKYQSQECLISSYQKTQDQLCKCWLVMLINNNLLQKQTEVRWSSIFQSCILPLFFAQSCNPNPLRMFLPLPLGESCSSLAPNICNCYQYIWFSAFHTTHHRFSNYPASRPSKWANLPLKYFYHACPHNKSPVILLYIPPPFLLSTYIGPSCKIEKRSNFQFWKLVYVLGFHPLRTIPTWL